MNHTFPTPFQLSWVGLCRVFEVANGFLSEGYGIDDFQVNTYKFLYEQCSEEQRQHIKDNYGFVVEYFRW